MIIGILSKYHIIAFKNMILFEMLLFLIFFVPDVGLKIKRLVEGYNALFFVF